MPEITVPAGKPAHWPRPSSPEQVFSIPVARDMKNSASLLSTAASICSANSRNDAISAGGDPTGETIEIVGTGDGESVADSVFGGEPVGLVLGESASSSSPQAARMATATRITAKHTGFVGVSYRSLTGSGNSPSRAASIILRASLGISMPNSSNLRSAQRPIWRGSL